jgi:hypothetical protein
MVFIRSGRLGNQLFQYFGLDCVRRPREQIVLYGFDDLRATFRGVEAIMVPRLNRVERLLVLAGSRGNATPSPSDSRTDPAASKEQRQTFERLAAGLLRRTSRSTSSRVSENFEGVPQRDPTNRFALGTNVYFENCANIDAARLGGLRFRPEVLQRARVLLQRVGLEARPYGFLHLRLGDLGGTAPDLAWFQRAIGELRRQRPLLPIVIASNDDLAAHRLSETADGLLVSGLDPSADLALLSLADAGILSVGTFGWWGARLAAEQARGPFLAPASTYGRTFHRWGSLGGTELQLVD